MNMYKKIVFGIVLTFGITIAVVGTPISLSPTGSASISSANAQLLYNLGLPWQLGGVTQCGTSITSSHNCTMSDVSAACLQNSANCTQSDQAILQVVAGCANGASYGCTAQQVQQAGQAQNLVQVSCNGLTDFWNAPTTCFGRTVATFLGTSLIKLSSLLLTVSGNLFDWAISQTIANFSQLVTQGVVTAINTAWSAFRDISNIIIIGMFTFIAIMTILGSVTYGAKKMISRVLIVAVLINFSLLFTKIIIDVSNFTALQFINSAGGVISQTASQSSSASANLGNTSSGASSSGTQSSDIAGQLMQYAGASSFGNTYTAISSIAQDPNNGGWIALAYGVVIGLLELIAAVVFLYGTILLISRALLMIFLMITSSIAFASYLVPSLSQNYGWSVWWNALLKNALFAPLLAVLLWVTLTIAAAFNVVQNNAAGSLGALIANPTATVDISALFGYLIVIGLLFISIRIASSFSGQIGGFNWAQAIAASPLTQGSRLGGFLGRRFVGNWAYGKEESRFADAKKNRDDAAEARRRGDLGAANSLDKKAASNLLSATRYAKVAHSSLNLMNTGIAKAVTKAAGLSGAAAGQSAKGAESAAAAIKRRADEAAKLAGKVTPSNDDKRRVREEAEKAITVQREGQEATKKAIQESAEKNAEALKNLAEQEKSSSSEHQTAKASVESAEGGKKDLLKKHDEEVKNLTQQIRAEVEAGRDPAAQKAQLDKHNVEHKNLLNEQDNRIKEAREHLGKVNLEIETKKFKIDTPEGPIETSFKEARDRAVAARSDFEGFKKETPHVVREAGRQAAESLTETADAVTNQVVQKQGPFIERKLGDLTGENHHVAEAARHKLKSKNTNAAKLREAFKEDVKEHEEPTDHGTGAGGAGGGAAH